MAKGCPRIPGPRRNGFQRTLTNITPPSGTHDAHGIPQGFPGQNWLVWQGMTTSTQMAAVPGAEFGQGIQRGEKYLCLFPLSKPVFSDIKPALVPVAGFLNHSLPLISLALSLKDSSLKHSWKSSQVAFLSL